MGYFSNNRMVTFEALAKVVNEQKKRIYSENLIKEIKNGNLNYLNDKNLEDRNDRDFMEPLLFAFRNKFNTYEIYKLYGEDLQKQDLTLAIEIAKNEPKVIEGTYISNKDTIMLYLVNINPEVVKYMSNDLKNDGEFIEAICETGNKEVISYAVKECNVSQVLQDNPELANNPNFMKEAIKENADLLVHASNDLKNNSEFIEQACKENREVISYVAEHTKEFGTESIEVAKNVLVENTLEDATKDIQERLAKINEEEATQGEVQTEQNEELKRTLASAQRIINRVKEGRTTPERAAKFLNPIREKLGEPYSTEIEQFLQMHEAVRERQEPKREITPEEIEIAAEDRTLSEIQEESKAIREEITSEREQALPEKEEEIGE